MSAADVQAYDLLFVICSDPTLDHGLFFFPSNLVGKNVLFILLHVSVQLLVVWLGVHVVRQQLFLNGLEVSHLFMVNALKAQNLIVEAALKIVDALFELVFKVCLTLKILPQQLFRKAWRGYLDVVETAIFRVWHSVVLDLILRIGMQRIWSQWWHIGLILRLWHVAHYGLIVVIRLLVILHVFHLVHKILSLRSFSWLFPFSLALSAFLEGYGVHVHAIVKLSRDVGVWFAAETYSTLRASAHISSVIILLSRWSGAPCRLVLVHKDGVFAFGSVLIILWSEIISIGERWLTDGIWRPPAKWPNRISAIFLGGQTAFVALGPSGLVSSLGLRQELWSEAARIAATTVFSSSVSCRLESVANSRVVMAIIIFLALSWWIVLGASPLRLILWNHRILMCPWQSQIVLIRDRIIVPRRISGRNTAYNWTQIFIRRLVRHLTMHLIFPRIWAHSFLLSLRFHEARIFVLSIVELLLLVHPIRLGHKASLATSILEWLKVLRPLSASTVLTHEYLFIFI